jgi:HPt (histidine-containing phosphotransfer) domain-containing protein
VVRENTKSVLVDSDAVVDLDVLLELLELVERDTSFIARLVDTFVDRARTLEENCRRAIDEGDRSCVEAVAHELRSSGAQLGALRLPRIARELEAVAADGTDSLRPAGERFLAEGNLVCAALAAQRGVIRSNHERVDLESRNEPNPAC